MALSPPTAHLGALGWVLGVIAAASCLVAAERLIRRPDGVSFDKLLAIAYGGVALTALMTWLDGGSAESPYRALFVIWLGCGVGVHPPRRALPFMVALLAAGALPLLS